MAGTAASQSSLNALHCDAIAHWKAQGESIARIVEHLEEGTHFGSEQPTPIQVTRSAVQYRLGTDDVSRRVLFWRTKLFGEMTSPLVFAAERMKRLETIWDTAAHDLEVAERPQDRSGARRDLLAVVAAAQRIAEQSKAEVTISQNALGGSRAEATISAESIEALAEQLEGLHAAGLLSDLPLAQNELPAPEGENGSGPAAPTSDA